MGRNVLVVILAVGIIFAGHGAVWASEEKGVSAPKLTLEELGDILSLSPELVGAVKVAEKYLKHGTRVRLGDSILFRIKPNLPEMGVFAQIDVSF